MERVSAAQTDAGCGWGCDECSGRRGEERECGRSLAHHSCCHISSPLACGRLSVRDKALPVREPDAYTH